MKKTTGGDTAYFMHDGQQYFAGKHFIVDFWGAHSLDNTQVLKTALAQAAKLAGATLLHIHLHEFSNGGVTGVALLAESHISVHTWPEQEYAAFDVFMCGSSEPEKAIDLLKEIFKPTSFDVKELFRGKQRESLTHGLPSKPPRPSKSDSPKS